MTEAILASVAIAGWLPYWLARLSRNLHIFQLEEYEASRLLRWLATARHQGIAVGPYGLDPVTLAGEGTLIVAMGMAALLPDWPLRELGVAGWAAVHLERWWRRPRATSKKPLVWTARVRRMLAATILVGGVGTAILAAVFGQLLLPSLVWMVILGQASGLALIAGNVVVWPIEASFRRYFLFDAASRIGKSRPTVIGIAGSYGKTTTRHITAALLSTIGPTLNPPKNWNTLLGVCRVIREQLMESHRFFTVEMGAYRRGDVRDLCRLTQPKIGVLTAIGPEHLDRFGSIENVILGEYEIVEGLPGDGVAIMNVDNPHVRALADRTTRVRVVRYGLEPQFSPDLLATNVRTSSEGVTFDVVRSGRLAFAATTALLGKHNVQNFLAGIAVALELGVSEETIVRALPSIPAPEHRLQVRRTPGGPTIIDDAYNANPAGVQAALDVLAEFPAGKKILVTPGMIELGAVEDSENHRFGEIAAGVCDHVILVGPIRTAPIAAGLRGSGFRRDRLHVVAGLDEATSCLRTIVEPSDVVLFCNDLPDQYVER